MFSFLGSSMIVKVSSPCRKKLFNDSNLEKLEDFKSLMFVDIYMIAYGIVC
jgi:hypothetical protein